eukprot:4185082-Pleurochrysis_carterae.AAC.1
MPPAGYVYPPATYPIGENSRRLTTRLSQCQIHRHCPGRCRCSNAPNLVQCRPLLRRMQSAAVALLSRRASSTTAPRPTTRYHATQTPELK